MSHNNGKIYIDTSVTPNKGIDPIADVAYVLGRNTGDYGQLCGDVDNLGVRVNAINKWAKNKPVRHSSVAVLTSAQRISALHGLQLPRYNATDFKTHYSDAWGYLPPRGKGNGESGANEWLRIRDFDGYIHDTYPMLGPVSANGLTYGYYTIFNGYLSTPRTQYIYPGDLITFYLKCKEEAGDESGLLFPYDFYREQQSYDDISKYYIGIAIITGTSNPTLWVITGDQMLSHITPGDTEAFLSANVPNSITPGAGARIIPFLASNQYPSWDNAPGNGYFLGLNGAYITRTIGSQSQKLTINVAVTYSNGSVTMVFTLTNNTSSDVLLKNLVAFISSAESFYNEGDSDHNPPTTGGYGIRDYLYEHWDTTSAESVPPFSAMGLTNPPNIYLSDWVSGLTPPAYLVGVGYNAYPDFKAANNNSTTIRVGQQPVTWTKTINIGQDDGCGYYSDGVFVSVCAFVNMSAYVEEFTDLT